MLTHTMYLDVVPGGLPPVVHVSQFDSGSRTLVIHLYASAGEFEIPPGATAKIRGTKRDNKGFDYSAELSGDTVTCDVTQNMTAISGRVYCEVEIDSGEQELMTANFILMVKPAAFADGTDLSDSDLPDFYELAAQIAEDAQTAQSAAQAAQKAAEDAAQFTPEGYQQMQQDVSELNTTVPQLKTQLTDEIEKNIFGAERPVKKDVYRKRLALQDLSGDSGYDTLQGGCYLSNTEHFLMAIVNSDNTSCILVELNKDYKTVVRRSSAIDLGHANDLAYNPTTNKIYVATGSTGTNANKIARLDGTTLALETTMDLGNSRPKWLCAYDAVNDRYYVLDTDYLTVYDSEWSQLKQYSNTYADDYAGPADMTAQSSFCYDGNFIALYFCREIVSSSQSISGIYFQMIDYETGEVKTVAQYSPRGNADEPEFVAIIGDVGYMFGGQTYFSVSEIYFDQSKLYDSPDNIFGIATLLPQNANLDDIQMPGMYFSPNTAYTTGMEHAPVTNGFTLYVLPVCGNVIVQMVINTAGEMYKRVLSSTTSLFLDWEQITSTQNPSDTGWATITPSGNYENIAAHPMQVKKVGNFIELSGAVRNTANAIGGSATEVTLGMTLDPEYRPSKMVVTTGTTQDGRLFQLRVNTDGTITASRATDAGSAGYTAIPESTAIFIHACYYAAT